METVSRGENVYRECPKLRGLKQNVSKVTTLGVRVAKAEGGRKPPLGES
jgi:hypothetical protein